MGIESNQITQKIGALDQRLTGNIDRLTSIELAKIDQELRQLAKSVSPADDEYDQIYALDVYMALASVFIKIKEINKKAEGLPDIPSFHEINDLILDYTPLVKSIGDQEEKNKEISNDEYKNRNQRFETIIQSELSQLQSKLKVEFEKLVWVELAKISIESVDLTKEFSRSSIMIDERFKAFLEKLDDKNNLQSQLEDLSKTVGSEISLGVEGNQSTILEARLILLERYLQDFQKDENKKGELVTKPRNLVEILDEQKKLLGTIDSNAEINQRVTEVVKRISNYSEGINKTVKEEFDKSFDDISKTCSMLSILSKNMEKIDIAELNKIVSGLNELQSTHIPILNSKSQGDEDLKKVKELNKSLDDLKQKFSTQREAKYTERDKPRLKELNQTLDKIKKLLNNKNKLSPLDADKLLSKMTSILKDLQELSDHSSDYDPEFRAELRNVQDSATDLIGETLNKVDEHKQAEILGKFLISFLEKGEEKSFTTFANVDLAISRKFFAGLPGNYSQDDLLLFLDNSCSRTKIFKVLDNENTTPLLLRLMEGDGSDNARKLASEKIETLSKLLGESDSQEEKRHSENLQMLVKKYKDLSSQVNQSTLTSNQNVSRRSSVIDSSTPSNRPALLRTITSRFSFGKRASALERSSTRDARSSASLTSDSLEDSMLEPSRSRSESSSRSSSRSSTELGSTSSSKLADSLNRESDSRNTRRKSWGKFRPPSDEVTQEAQPVQQNETSKLSKSSQVNSQQPVVEETASRSFRRG